MSNCLQCWWADYNKGEDRHHKHMEPDYLTMKSPLDTPKEIRIVKSCAEGENFFKAYGALDHNCAKFENFATRDAQRESNDAAARKKWKGKTSRKALQDDYNMFQQIEVMSESDSKAYDHLCDALAELGEGGFNAIILNLDDMNMRGEQISLALDYCEGSLVDLSAEASKRTPALVKYVNDNYDNVSNEVAVERGAHRLGHASGKAKKKLVT